MFMYLCGNKYYEAETSIFFNIAPTRRVGSWAVSCLCTWLHTPLGAWPWLRLRCQRFFRLFRTFSNIYGHIYESYLVMCMYVYIFMWKYVFWRRNTDHLKKGCSPGLRTRLMWPSTAEWKRYSCAGVILSLDLIIVFVDDRNASQIHQITKILIPGHFTTLFISNLSFLNMIFIADVKTVVGLTSCWWCCLAWMETLAAFHKL